MIRIPFDQVVEKIKAAKGLSEADIVQRIDAKLEQLGGLISKDGAAHIIANELGVQLINPSERKQVKDILSGMRGVELVAKVQTVFEGREFSRTDGSKGKVGSAIVGDETGTIRVVCWGDHADVLPKLSKDVVVKVTNGYARDSNRGYKELHLNANSKLLINPEGESVGEVVSTRPKAKRKEIKDLLDNDENVEVLGHIVQVFDPRFFEVCPTCGKRARGKDGAFVCEEHGGVTPSYSYLLNVFIDDGTDNIRVTFFKNQMERLTGKSDKEMEEFRLAPEKFEDVKTELLGSLIKLVGRVRNNTFFNRLEFNAQLVFTDPSPDDELKTLGTV